MVGISLIGNSQNISPDACFHLEPLSVRDVLKFFAGVELPDVVPHFDELVQLPFR